MNKPAIFGVLLLGVGGYAAASCTSDDNNTSSSGGQPSAAGGTSTAGQAGAAGSSSGGAAGSSACGNVAGSAGNYAQFEAGGAGGAGGQGTTLVRIGFTDPSQSVALQDGGYYVMPNNKYKGYCFTYDDKAGSVLYPPCGELGPCFTTRSGLCLSAALGAYAANTWGGGFGCSINQQSTAGAAALYTDVIGMSSMTIGVYGCAVPDQLQVQLNVVNAPVDADSGVPGSGYFCNRATLGPADANGVRSVTIQFADLRQDCWNAGGPLFDAATMYVKSIQAQVNTIEGAASNWDFCVSSLSIQ